ncbi:malate dehydrogenase [Candidatus Saganbacteria bacterium]|nr:malate dehydrogenase [Candidatus Saganbacteria bacterium]
MRKKITLVGAGHVGATCAHDIAAKNLGDVVLLDVVEGLPQGLGLDMLQAAPIEGFDGQILGTNDYADTKNSDLYVITAGLARKPGMTREDLLRKNAQIIKSTTEQIKKYSPDSIIIVVTNPLDIMCQVALSISGFESRRVMGMAGILDAARFRAFISLEFKVPAREISAMVLGGHGDAMVPLPRLTLVKGKPLTDLLPKEKIDSLVERTKNGGAEIVNLLKTGSAYYAPAAAAALMAEAVLLDQKKLLPCSAYLNGQYGLKEVYIGVPVKLGRSGIEEIVELKLAPEEISALKRSAAVVSENFNILKGEIL